MLKTFREWYKKHVPVNVWDLTSGLHVRISFLTVRKSAFGGAAVAQICTQTVRMVESPLMNTCVAKLYILLFRYNIDSSLRQSYLNVHVISMWLFISQ